MSNGKQFSVLGHRHDQSILSILRIRHKLPTVLKTWEFYEFRSLEHAQKNNSLFFNHHGSYEVAKFQRGDIPSCLSTKTPCIVNCM